MKHYFTLILIFVGLIFVSSCGNDKAKKKVSKKAITTTKAKKTRKKVPVFNGDSAYAYVAKQVNFGPRVTGSKAHKDAQKWFIETFKSYGAKVKSQDFKAAFHFGKTENAKNIIASFNEGKSKKVIIAAHYDSRYEAEKDKDPKKKHMPIDGADDGASGVGVILELARIISQNPLDISVDFILFDAEDNGNSEGGDDTWCLGSQYWAKQAVRERYRADFGILLDMVGAKNAVFPKEMISTRFAQPLQDAIWNVARDMGYGDLFADIPRGQVNDDHLYVNRDAGIPMVDIINIPNPDHRFGDYHHTHKDNMDNIDKNTLRRAGQVVLAVLYKYETNSLF